MYNQNINQAEADVMIEAGHYYSGSGLSDFSQLGWEIGKYKVKHEYPGQMAKIALFIDDYNSFNNYPAEGEVFRSPDEAVSDIQQMKAETDYLYYESDYAKKSLGALAVLLNQEGTPLKTKKDRHDKSKHAVTLSGIRLATVQFENSNGDLKSAEPTCAYMDYLLLKDKAAVSPNQVVVLPESYARQQHQLISFVDALGVDGLKSYTNSYFKLNELNTRDEVLCAA